MVLTTVSPEPVMRARMAKIGMIRMGRRKVVARSRFSG